MLRFIAQFISFALHPLLIPTWLFALLLYFQPSSIYPAQVWGLISILVFFGMTFFLPVINLVFFRMTGIIQSFKMIDRRERVLPSVLITVVYAVISFMFYWKVPMPVFFKLMSIVTLLSLTVTMANFFFKISAHAVGMSGLAGILLLMATLSSASELIVPALVVIVLAGFTMSSRLLLNAHTLNEVGWGGILGFAVAVMGMLVLF